MSKYDEWMCCFAGAFSFLVSADMSMHFYRFMIKKGISTEDDINDFVRDKTYYMYIRGFAETAGQHYDAAQEESVKSGMKTILVRTKGSYQMLTIISLLMDIGCITSKCFEKENFVAVGKIPVMINRFMNDVPRDCVPVAVYFSSTFLLTYVHKTIRLRKFDVICADRTGPVRKFIEI